MVAPCGRDREIEMKTPTRSPGLAGAWAAGIALTLAACGGSDASEVAAAQEDVVPIQSTESTTEADSISPGADNAAATTGSEPISETAADLDIDTAQAMYREYVQCMRDEGVTMAPAAFTADGKIDLDAEIAWWEDQAAEDLDGLDQTDYESAEENCLPENAEAALALIAPDESEIADLEAGFEEDLTEDLTAISQCMRKEFPDFPDPIIPDLSGDAGAGAIEVDPFPGIDPEDPAYEAAFLACADEIGLEVGPGEGN